MSLIRLRTPLLGLSILLLLAAIWAGWIRLGWGWPVLQPSLVLVHGPLMVSGFLGTLISLERAVALRAGWMFLGPALSALGGLLLILNLGGSLGPLLLALASLLLVLIFITILRRHTALYTAVMTLGALTWLVGSILWLAGWPVYRFVLWWAAFLILTIGGERLELGRIRRLSRKTELAFLVAVGALVAGLVISLGSYAGGTRLAGLGMLALAAWFALFDIARRTVRRAGLPRYIAACLLAGYAWLAVAGLLGLTRGGQPAGPFYDAFLHAIFLGFVFSMIFGHAPLIFPAILGRQYRFHPLLYSNLALLHLSLGLRVAGDLLGLHSLRLWGGLLNGIALLIFLISTFALILISKEGEGRSYAHSGDHIR